MQYLAEMGPKKTVSKSKPINYRCTTIILIKYALFFLKARGLESYEYYKENNENNSELIEPLVNAL